MNGSTSQKASQLVVTAPTVLTDVGNKNRFVAGKSKSFRFDHTAGRWHRYDGRRWAVDVKNTVREAAEQVVEEAYIEAFRNSDKSGSRHAFNSHSKHRLDAMLSLAQSSTKIAVDHTDWDKDRWLLNVANGTLDLHTGRLRAHLATDLITKLARCEYISLAPCDRWQEFLDQIFNGDQNLIAFVQRAVGLSLIGEVREHVVFICHGGGANGKSTFLAVLDTIFGDYARVADPELLLSHREGQHSTGEADLVGARFVSTTETGDGRRFGEATVKRLTGGDKRKARFMRKDFFEYVPSDTIWIATNHKPQVKDTSDGFWRRVRLIPFTVSIPPAQQVPDLKAQLLAEAPGILAWAVRGCLDYRANGLGSAHAVDAATASYRADEDVLAGFLAERCEIGPDAFTAARSLYIAYVDWCNMSGEHSLSETKFGKTLIERGYERTGNFGKDRCRAWKTIGLIDLV